MATQIERLVVRLVGNTQGFVVNMRGAAGSFKSSAAQMERSAARVKFAVDAMAVTIGVFSVVQFAKFDKALTESLAIMDVTQQEIKEMTRLSLRLGSIGKQGPEDLARAYFFLASAGLNARQAMASLAAMQQFATAGNFSLERATKLAAGAQNTLGLASQDAATHMKNLRRVTDVLVKANVLAQATTEQFAEALTVRAGPTLRAYNKSIEEGVATLAVYAKQNIVGMEAGTFLRRTLLLLSQSALKAADAHAQFGFRVFDTSGKMRNLADIAQNLEEITEGMSDKTRAATLRMLGFQFRIQQAILPLIGMSSELRRFEKLLTEAGGTTKKVSDKQLTAFTNQVRILWNQVKVAAILIGKELAPSLLGLGKVAVSIFHSFSLATTALLKVTTLFTTVIKGVMLPVMALSNAIFRDSTTLFGVLGAAVMLVAAAWLAYRLAVVGATVAMVFWQAIRGGPKAWIAIGIAIAVATLAVKSYTRELENAGEAQAKLNKESKTTLDNAIKAAKAAPGAGGGQFGGGGGAGKADKVVIPDLQAGQAAALRRSIIAPQIEAATKAIAKLEGPIRQVKRDLKIFAEAQEKVNHETREGREHSKDLLGRMIRQGFALEKLEASAKPHIESLKTLNRENQKLSLAIALVNKELEANAQRINRLQFPINPTNRFNDALAAANISLATGKINFAQYFLELQRLEKEFDKATGGGVKFAKEMERQRRVLEQNASGFKIFGQVTGEIEERLAELTKAGASTETLRKVSNAFRKLAESKQSAQFLKIGGELSKRARTPLEIYMGKIEELQNLFAQGFLDPDDLAKLEKMAKLSFDKSTGLGRAKSLIEGLRTPLQKYKDDVLEVQKLWLRGHLNMFQFVALTHKLSKEFKESKKEASRLVDKFDAAGIGSLEALSRVRKFGASVGSDVQFATSINFKTPQQKEQKKFAEMEKHLRALVRWSKFNRDWTKKQRNEVLAAGFSGTGGP